MADVDAPTNRATGSALSPEVEDAAETLHVWLCAAGIALQPISTATGNIGFVIALSGLGLRMGGVSLQPISTSWGGAAVAICQIPRLLKSRRLVGSWVKLLGQPWMWCMLGWLVWSWISLAWSPDRRFGIEQFRATRVLLWIPLLWPIRHRWYLLVGAVLAGTTTMAMLQASQIRFGWPEPKYGVGSGFTTPTQTGLWAAVALSFWLIVVVAAHWRSAIPALALAMLSGVSLVWSATRASVLGLAAEVCLANAVLCFTTQGWIRRALLRALAGLAILAAAWWFAGALLEQKIEQAVRETAETVTGKVSTTAEERLAMWLAGLKAWQQAPIFGTGIGGVPRLMSGTDVRHTSTDLRTVTMIHSTYVQALVETGLIGLGLLLGFIALLFRDVLRGLRGRPLLVASFGALVVWFVAAAFDGYQQSGGFLSVGAILIPLALADLRKTPVEAGH